jgi:hypothetical protein
MVENLLIGKEKFLLQIAIKGRKKTKKKKVVVED